MNISKTGSTHAGLTEWLFQRLTALYMTGFFFFIVVRLGWWPIQDYGAWQAWFANGWIRVAWLLFFASLLVHAWIGMRSVFLDYVKPFWLRFTVTVLLGAGLMAIGLWVVEILYIQGAP